METTIKAGRKKGCGTCGAGYSYETMETKIKIYGELHNSRRRKRIQGNNKRS